MSIPDNSMSIDLFKQSTQAHPLNPFELSTKLHPTNPFEPMTTPSLFAPVNPFALIDLFASTDASLFASTTNQQPRNPFVIGSTTTNPFVPLSSIFAPVTFCDLSSIFEDNC